MDHFRVFVLLFKILSFINMNFSRSKSFVYEMHFAKYMQVKFTKISSQVRI